MHVALRVCMYCRSPCQLRINCFFSFSAEASHVLVSFFEEEDQPTCIIPVKRVQNCEVRDLKAGVVCKVEWSDKNIYSARVLDVGECDIQCQ